MKARKKQSKAKKRKPQPLGVVTHYFGKINVAVVKLKSPLKVGGYIKFQTKDREFVQVVDSMQINHRNINTGRKGAEVGLKVAQKVKEGNLVFKSQKPAPLKPVQPEPPPPPPSPSPIEKKNPTAYGDVKFLRF